MLFNQVACIFAFLIYIQKAESYDVDTCSVGYQKIDGMWVDMNLTEFENHIPKKNEILRTKAFLKGKFPAFRITNNGNEINFGKTRDNVWRIIHFPVDDFESFDEPCFTKLATITFSEHRYNEVHFVLRSKFFFFILTYFLNNFNFVEDGLFSVTVLNGDLMTTFSCPPVVISYDSKKPTEVGFVTEDGKKSFLYDC